jgi:hypothetical protein
MDAPPGAGDAPWLLAKIVGLVVYVGLGVVALRPGRPRARARRGVARALAVVAWIVSVALTKSPLGFLGDGARRVLSAPALRVRRTARHGVLEEPPGLTGIKARRRAPSRTIGRCPPSSPPPPTSARS